MVRPERDRIQGEVEVDETYVGGVELGRQAGRLRDSPNRSSSALLRSAARAPGGFGSVSSRICLPHRWLDSSKSRLLPAVSYTPTAGVGIVLWRSKAMSTGAERKDGGPTPARYSPACIEYSRISRPG